VSGRFFFSVLNKCSPLARTSAITVCFPLAETRRITPAALPLPQRALKGGGASSCSEAQQGVSKKPPGFSSTPHLSVHGAYVPTPHPSIHRREIAGGNWCCSTASTGWRSVFRQTAVDAVPASASPGESPPSFLLSISEAEFMADCPPSGRATGSRPDFSQGRRRNKSSVSEVLEAV
ncbi:hypothetical protein KUCAC02_023616, partial [Chaenocephalus aceratus]